MKEIIYLFVTLVMFIANCILCKSAKNDVRKEKYVLVLLGGFLTIFLFTIIDLII